MRSDMELQQIIYETLRTQIQFGAFHYMEGLSSANEVSEHFHVSVDTVQLAYRRLKREGYISLSRNVGAKVVADYDAAEIERHIQAFFAFRKDALLDLSSSVQPLLGHIQWLGLKHASAETLENIERFYEKHARQPYAMWQYFEQKYTAFGNGILIRLARQVFLFFQAPFFSVAGPAGKLRGGPERVQDTLELCRRKDWQALQSLLDSYQQGLCAALHDFYRERITAPPPQAQVAFCWSAYKKPGQLCYSLAMELLVGISRGVYPPGSLLPTMEWLSEEKAVSISTVRRAMGLLVSIGAVKSSRPYGMRVLPILDSAKNCDFTQPGIRHRLVEMLESLQIFALSCRAVAEVTLDSLDAEAIEAWKRRLAALRDSPYYDVLSYAVFELITNSVPYETIRTIYSELLQQQFWGNPLRGMKGDREATNALLEPYLTSLLARLEEGDIPGFCEKLEELMLYELRDSKSRLLQVGILEAGAILAPEK